MTNPTEKAMISYSISREATDVIVQARVNLKLMPTPITCMKLEERQLKLRTSYLIRNIVAFLIKLVQRFKETFFGAKNKNISSWLTVLPLMNRFICARI